MKKRTLGIILLHAVIVFVLALGFFMFSDEMLSFKLKVYDISDQVVGTLRIKRNPPSLEGYEELRHTGEEWYASTHVIRHAGGGVDGFNYTNSREAVEKALQDGCAVIEIDFRYTSDGHLVCVHEWDNVWDSGDVMTLEEFQSVKIYGKYSTMTAKDLIEYMEQREDLYIVIDTKEDDQVDVTRELVELSEGNKDVIDRFIIQLYSLDDVKQRILKIYPFSDDNFLFTGYRTDTSDREKIIQMCYEQNVSVIPLPCGAWEPGWIAELKKKGFIVYEHTVNRLDQASACMREGVFGFYTDFLTEADLLSGAGTDGT